MNFFRRKAKAIEPAPQQEIQTIVHRYIEIIHEREWVAVPPRPAILAADKPVAPPPPNQE